ncbi:copper resistance protein NlpE N-terminal domain-containing protein [Chitinophaga pendula]|uniref:copper resistance protein NlpE N-terminal domain-containing protein n=1 Tax=Chitinophaga TaxID=79328 RepID=UPI000BAE8814|nr:MULTISPECIES: copper resistance protein NlpE N-terminal domain-containing protein [Chitinophaga]ASZ10133.1 hypothetical protein CK934_03635 [Chitinophaga sp. MD30]UCJ06912.1 copper resistance protein NlpE N-terminal domain-containing protein [Chitinophaga pendula]
MTSRIAIFTVLLATTVACNNHTSTNNDHNIMTTVPASPPSVPAGAYQGTIPCADCPGIIYQLTFLDNNQFQDLTLYQERNNNKAFTDVGSWKLLNDSIIILERKQPQQLLFKENRLFFLDQTGNRKGGSLNDNYILRPVEGANASIRKDKAAKGISFTAGGNEPNWSIDLRKGNKITFHTSQLDSLEIPIPPARPNTDSLKVYTASTKAGNFKLSIRDQACLDDMSGFMRPIAVELQLGDKTYHGCGEYIK